jgi:hypothetical protein
MLPMRVNWHRWEGDAMHRHQGVRVMSHGNAVLATIILLGIMASASAMPPLPAEFYGTLTIGGAPAPVGTIVTASINGVECGSLVTTIAGEYGGPGRYDRRLAVVPDESLLIGLTSPTVTFFVNNVEATPNALFVAGSSQEVDIAAPQSAGTVITTTPTSPIVYRGGGGSSGGGGGSAGSSSMREMSSQPEVPVKTTYSAQALNETDTIPLDADGRVSETTTITSPDTHGQITLDKGTRTHTLSGDSVSRIQLIEPDPSAITISEGLQAEFTGMAYDCQPGGVYFDPPVTLTFTIPDEKWEEVRNSPLVVRWFDAANGTWIENPTTVDYTRHTVSVKVAHFSVYGVFRQSSVAQPPGPDSSPSINKTGGSLPSSLSSSPVLSITGITLIFVILSVYRNRKKE